MHTFALLFSPRSALCCSSRFLIPPGQAHCRNLIARTAGSLRGIHGEGQRKKRAMSRWPACLSAGALHLGQHVAFSGLVLRGSSGDEAVVAATIPR